VTQSGIPKKIAGAIVPALNGPSASRNQAGTAEAPSERPPRHYPYKRSIDMKVTPEILRSNKEIRDMLWPFDFVVVDSKEYGPVWFDTAPA
jgi:hypothetical protein